GGHHAGGRHEWADDDDEVHLFRLQARLICHDHGNGPRCQQDAEGDDRHLYQGRGDRKNVATQAPSDGRLDGALLSAFYCLECAAAVAALVSALSELSTGSFVRMSITPAGSLTLLLDENR